MSKFAFFFYFCLFAGTAAAFQLHHQVSHLSIHEYRKGTTVRHPKCTFNHFVLADNNGVEVEKNGKSWESDLLLNATTGVPSNPPVLVFVPTHCRSKKDMDPKIESNIVLDQSVKVLWGTLFFLLFEPLCVVAESVPEAYLEKFNFLQILVLSPGFSMLLIVFGVLSFGYDRLESGLNSKLDGVKTEVNGVKADLQRMESGVKAEVNGVKAEVNGVKTDLQRMESGINARFDILIGSINGRLENQDKKIENAIKELGLKKKEIDISNEEH